MENLTTTDVDIDVFVSARHDIQARDDPTLHGTCFLIKTDVTWRFQPSDWRIITRSLLMHDSLFSSEFFMLSDCLTSDDGAPGSRSWDLMSRIAAYADTDDLAPATIPQQRWRSWWQFECPWGGSQRKILLETREALVRLLLTAARHAAAVHESAGRKIVPLHISFEKKVALGTHDFDLLRFHVKRKEDLKSTIASVVKQALDQDLDYEALMGRVEEAVRKFALEGQASSPSPALMLEMKALAEHERAAIMADDLPNVTVEEARGAAEEDEEEEEEDKKVCPICMETLPAGTVAKCMPCACAYLYHPHCVVQWLKRKMTCPTCRFRLPLPAL